MYVLEIVNQKLKGSANSQPLGDEKNSPRVTPVSQIVQQLRPQSSPIVKSAFQHTVGPAYKTVQATSQTVQLSRPLIKQFNCPGHLSNSSTVQATYQTVQQFRPLMK
jgi:hypothetical protein